MLLKKLLKPENIFLILAVFWGVILIFINPPFQSFDEPEHFYKIYAFTDGTLNFKKITSITDGTLIFDEPKTFAAQIIPVSIVRIIVESKKLNPYFDINKTVYPAQKITPKTVAEQAKYPLDKKFLTITVHMIPSYTIVSYLPHTVTLAALKAFNTPPVYMMFMLRLCSLFLYTALIYAAIKIAPVKKYVFTLIAVAPLPVYLGATINTDHLVIGLGFLLIAYFLKLLYKDDEEKIKTKELFLFFVLIFLICVCKFTYLPMVFLLLAIPEEKFETACVKIKAFITMFLFCTGWITGFLIYNINIFKGTFSYYNRSAFESIISIFQNPLDYILCLIKTIVLYFNQYAPRILSDFGCSDTNVSGFVISGYFVLLILSALFLNKQQKSFSLKQKYIFIFIILSVLVLILTANYLIFSYKPQGLIEGFKGRYLLPVLPLFLFLFDNRRLKPLKINLFTVTIVYSLIFMLCFIFTLINRYYLI